MVLLCSADLAFFSVLLSYMERWSRGSSVDSFRAQDYEWCTSLLLALDWPEIIISVCKKVGICSQVECQWVEENPKLWAPSVSAMPFQVTLHLFLLFPFYHSWKKIIKVTNLCIVYYTEHSIDPPQLSFPLTFYNLVLHPLPWSIALKDTKDQLHLCQNLVPRTEPDTQ